MCDLSFDPFKAHMQCRISAECSYFCNLLLNVMCSKVNVGKLCLINFIIFYFETEYDSTYSIGSIKNIVL